MVKLDGAVAVVTGAASGMGRELAVGLARRGVAGLAVCDVNAKDMEETVALARAAAVRPNMKVVAERVDVADRTQVAAFRAKVLAEMDRGATLVLFNNAGINAVGKMVYEEGDDPAAFERLWDKCFDIDFFGVVNFTREFLPAMRARPAAHLVNTASVNAFYTWPQHTCYTAAKHAVKGFSESLMLELYVAAPHVKVTTLYPGGVKTNIAARTEHPAKGERGETFKRVTDFVYNHVFDLQASEAADWILAAVERDQARALIGYDAVLIDKMTRAFPSAMYGFYPTLGTYGLSADLTTADRNDGKIGPLSALHVLASGLWLHGLFLSPMVLVKLSRVVSPTTLMAAAGVGLAARAAGKL